MNEWTNDDDDGRDVHDHHDDYHGVDGHHAYGLPQNIYYLSINFTLNVIALLTFVNRALFNIFYNLFIFIKL